MIKRSMVFISILMILFSCNRLKNKLVWDDVKYDKKVKNLDEFKDMNRVYNSNPLFGDTNRYKKNCNVYNALILEKKKKMYATDSEKYYCAAYILHDTLFVNLGCMDVFTAYGLKINVVQKKFSIFTYFVSDARSDEKEENVPKVETQYLVLNKSNYSIGDSIFGQFYLKTISKPDDREFDRIEYYSGEFKCKID